MSSVNIEPSSREIAWFGHSICSISDKYVFCFGGAIETTKGVYSTTNDSFIIDKQTFKWIWLQSKLIRCRTSAL